jgi:peptidoglycan hydrolase CwlO-like protein
MPLQDLLANLDTQIAEHKKAKDDLQAAQTALEEMKKALEARQQEIDVDTASEKAELGDVRAALQAIRDEADRQLAALGGAGGGVGPAPDPATTAAARRGFSGT